MNELQAANKEQAIRELADFIRAKYDISLDDLDRILNGGLKQWLDTYWQFELGVVSAFISFGTEELVIDRLGPLFQRLNRCTYSS